MRVCTFGLSANTHPQHTPHGNEQWWPPEMIILSYIIIISGGPPAHTLPTHPIHQPPQTVKSFRCVCILSVWAQTHPTTHTTWKRVVVAARNDNIVVRYYHFWWPTRPYTTQGAYGRGLTASQTDPARQPGAPKVRIQFTMPASSLQLPFENQRLFIANNGVNIKVKK